METPVEPNEKLNMVANNKKKAKSCSTATLVNSFCELITQEYKSSLFETEYLRDRTFWYTRAAERNKRCYYIFTILATTLPLIVTVVTSIDGLNNWRDWVAACLSTLVAICSFLVGHFRLLEHWTNYRSVIESILREMNQLACKAGCYKDVEDHIALRLFTERIDELIGDEQAKWCEKQLDRKDGDKKPTEFNG